MTMTRCSSIVRALLKRMLIRMLNRMLKPMPRNMLHDAPSNAQTDKQTYKQPLTLGNYLTLGNARRGAARFSSDRGETACAARGLDGGTDA